MTDPALDGPDAERRLATVLAATYGPAPTSEQVDAAIHALNEADVVLCDHDALAELRQQAKASDDLWAEARHLYGEIADALPGAPCDNCGQRPHDSIPCEQAWGSLHTHPAALDDMTPVPCGMTLCDACAKAIARRLQ